jgi:hypothetical protein
MVGFDISKFQPSSSATIVLFKCYGLPYGSISHVLLYNLCLIMYHMAISHIMVIVIIFLVT